MAYKNIPVDEDTHSMLMDLCAAYEFGKRGQGAMVRKLVRAEHEKLAEVKLLPSQREKVEPQPKNNKKRAQCG